MKDDNIFLGFDPGGKSGFGAAFLVGTRVETVTVSSVGEAIEWAVRLCSEREPVSAGIDSLLHWSDGPGGWRPVDTRLRLAYPAAAASVISPNGLYGAMAVGGMALALRLRERWPEVCLNETHPKLLLPALGGERYSDFDPAVATAWFGSYADLDISGVEGGHELDALISAWVTRYGVDQGWVDLVGDDPALIRPAGVVRYLWPVPLAKSTMEPAEAPARSATPTATGRGRQSRKTTEAGYINQHRQEVVRKTDLAGSDHGQRVYVLRCNACGHEYGANGSDIWQRRCPKHDGGAAGLLPSNI